MTKWVKSFSKGSFAPEHYGEKNDCAVRAISNACNVSYQSAHYICKLNGRKKREGMYSNDFHRALMDLGCIDYNLCFNKKYFTFDNTYSVDKGISLGRFLKEYTGTWIVMISGHFLAIDNGKVIDDGYNKAGSHVIYAWKVK